MHRWLIGDGNPFTRAELHLTHGHLDRLALERLILRLDFETELNWNEEFEASTSFDLMKFFK